MTAKSMVDPVCGMTVSADEGVSLTYEGVMFHFCSETCRREFLRHPRSYVDIPSTAAAGVSSPGSPGTRSP